MTVAVDSSETKTPYADFQKLSPEIMNFDVVQKMIASEKEQFDYPTEGSDVVEFFRDKCVFVTGASGFLGKVLVEKLLRTCKHIQTVYILMREKKGKDVSTRVDEIYSDVFFSKLATQQPKFRHKIVHIVGDVGLPDLGISPENRETLKEKVSVIFHAAATVRFDERIKTAVHINVRGTKDMLILAKECKKLQSFVHVSTAYAFCVSKEIKETFYETPYDTDAITTTVNSIPEDILDAITPELIGKYPNTYAFTKAIAEQTVQKYGQGLPMCVYRPAIVIATYKEPFRSWIDNVYGATGVAVGAGLGLLRTLHCDPNVKADMVPVDLTVAGMIVAAYRNHAKRHGNEIPIYNYVSSAENPITWGRWMELLETFGYDTPSTQSVWYCDLKLNKHILMHWLYVILFHYTTALILDALSMIVGKKPQLMRAYKKIHKFSNVIAFFCTNEWEFRNENVQKMWNEISEIDRRLFPFNMKDMNWEDLNSTICLGFKMYLLKENYSSILEGRKRHFRLRILQYTLRGLVIFFALRLLCWILYSFV